MTGPIDGNAGPGTQSAIKRFQRDLGKAENGTLDDAAERGAFPTRTKSRFERSRFLRGNCSIRERAYVVGIPFSDCRRKTRTLRVATDSLAADGRVQIGLRLLQTDQRYRVDCRAVLEATANLVPRSLLILTSRSNWFVLAGENDEAGCCSQMLLGRPSRLRLCLGLRRDPAQARSTGPLVSAITVMSLTMQSFAADIKGASVSKT